MTGRVRRSEAPARARVSRVVARGGCSLAEASRRNDVRRATRRQWRRTRQTANCEQFAVALRGAGRNRTGDWEFCRLLPYHLATAPKRLQSSPAAKSAQATITRGDAGSPPRTPQRATSQPRRRAPTDRSRVTDARARLGRSSGSSGTAHSRSAAAARIPHSSHFAAGAAPANRTRTMYATLSRYGSTFAAPHR